MFIASVFWKFCYIQCILKKAERLKKIFINSIIVESAVVFIYVWIVLNPSVRKWFLTE